MKLKIPKLSYRQKTLRNIVVMILLFVFIWMNAGSPLPTTEMNFRRFERKIMVEPTEIVLHIPEKNWDDLIVGVGEDIVLAAEVRAGATITQSYWLLEGWEGVKLIVSPGFHSCHLNDWPLSCRKVIALDMPEGAVRAELEVFRLELMNNVCRAEGARLENGIWVFHMNDGQNAPPGYDYKLTVYGPGEEILLKQEGELRKADNKY